MKHLKYILITPAIIIVLLLVQACKKTYLDVAPTGALSEQVLANKTGVEALLIGAYHELGGNITYAGGPSNWVFGSVAADEAYKGSTASDQNDIIAIESWAYNTNNGFFNDKWNALYNGIGRANETIRMIPKATDLSADDQKRITAEARFLRGYYHFELKKMFNYVPYVSDSITVANNNTNVSNVDASGTYVNIWPQIEADFQNAVDNLPETHPQAGRANKWAAMAFLAKVYVYEHQYAKAKPLFDEIIANGKTTNGQKYALVNYFSNFNPAQDNSAESVFAYQASVNEGSATNGNYADVLNYPNSGGPGGCCGFFNPSITMTNAYKTDPVTGLPLFDAYNTGNNVSSPTNPYVGTLDPRVDLIAGRPGIPYLDWGKMDT